MISREKFLAILNDISFAAIKSQDLTELYQLLADRLAEIINADGCYITLWDSETGQVRPGAAYGPLRDLYSEIVIQPDEKTLTHSVLETGKSLVVPDLRTTSYVSNRLTRAFPARSMLAIPVYLEETKLGAVLFAFNEPHEFLEQEIEYCEQAVRQIIPAIANLLNLNALKLSERGHRLAKEALQEREAHLAKAQANARMGSWENDIKLGNAVWSDELFRLFDLQPELGVPPDDQLIEIVRKEDRKHFRKTLYSAVETGVLAPLEFETVHGRRLAGEIYVDQVQQKVMGMLQDVTEQRKLENELSQARKMEVVGTLAGGIAHNFNNILTVIMGNYEILKDSIQEGSPERKVLDQCLSAVDRAAVLTRQLLVVSRKHELRPSLIDMNSLITEVVDLLRPLIGEHITITTSLRADLPSIHVDSSHLEQVIMNLMLNARDALESGGKLDISTQLVRENDVTWSVIKIEDDGTGIESDNLPHIFEPFYTTKNEGKGTGLGLATVASIVEQSNGLIEVQSKFGEGTMITVRFPSGTSNNLEPKEDPNSEHFLNLNQNLNVSLSEKIQAERPQSQTILIIEDHDSLREVACFALKKSGYNVLAAADGEQAREIFANHPSIDLLLTDFQLPGETGIQLITELLTDRNDLPVIFMSGLPENQKHTGNATFLAKPFRPHELIAAVEAELSV